MRTHQSVRQNPRATALEVSLITEHFGYAPARRQNGKVSAHPAKRKSTSSVLHRHAERRVQFPGTPLVLPRLADLRTNGTRPPDRRTLLARFGAQEFDPGAIVNQHGVHHRTGLLGRYTPESCAGTQAPGGVQVGATQFISTSHSLRLQGRPADRTRPRKSFVMSLPK